MEQGQFKWLDKKEYPFQSNYYEVNGQRLHYIEEGEGPVILFVHGTPSWSFDFRNVILKLKNEYKCIAIDHIGFGLSDKPENYDYSTINHSNTLTKFIADKSLKDITLVLHDFGAPIGFNAAMNLPEKIKKIIILNSWLWDNTADPDFKQLSKLLKSPLLPFLYKHFNFSPKYILPSTFGKQKLSKKILKQYTGPFSRKSERNGTIAFAKSLLNDQDWFQELWNKRREVSHLPILIIWGMADPVIKPHNLEKFKSGFPNAKATALETCGHFPQEEQPIEVSNAIDEFMQENT